MNAIFAFGEQVDGYPVRVVNERAVRAAAGLLFVAVNLAVDQTYQFLDPRLRRR